MNGIYVLGTSEIHQPKIYLSKFNAFLEESNNQSINKLINDTLI